MTILNLFTAISVISLVLFLSSLNVDAETSEERRVADSSFLVLDTPGEEKTFRDVFFDQGDFRLREDAKPVLKENAEILTRYPDINVVIAAYCNNAEYKLDSSLGQKRAESTKAYLTSLGVESHRMSLRTSSGGESYVGRLLSHLNPAWQLNSRVHFTAVEKRWEQNAEISRSLASDRSLANGSSQEALLTNVAFPSPIYCYFDSDDGSFLKYIRPSCEVKHHSWPEAQRPQTLSQE